jgi:intraflagellar transport protein 122
VPAAWRDQIDLACLTIRSKAYADAEELLPVCYRCSSTNPLLSNRGQGGDQCTTCGHPFIRSYVSFEILPLVEFTIADDVTHEEALKLLDEDRVSKKKGSGGIGKKASSRPADEERLVLDDQHGADSDDDADGDGGDDGFTKLLIDEGAPAAGGAGDYKPLVCSRRALRSMRKEEVFVAEHSCAAIPRKYYKSVMSDLPIVMCDSCQHFFHEEDYEFHVLQHQACPFCRTAIKNSDLMPDKKEDDDMLLA